MQNQISVFNFRTTEVRTVIRNGDPWFVLADVVDALGFSRSRDAARMLDDDEKGAHIVRTPGGDQEMIVINESGVYSLALRSRKPEAKPFRKWVTAEVLPTIRKTGQYIAAPYSVNPTDTLTKEQADTLRQMLSESAKQRYPDDTKKQGAFIQRGWSKLKTHFKVSYRDIPQIEFTEAVSIAARHAIEGEYMPASDPSINDLVERLTRQIETGNGTPAEIFQPLVFAVLKKCPEMVGQALTDEHLNQLATQQLRKTRFVLEFGGSSDYFGTEFTPRMIPFAKGAKVLKPGDVVEEVASNRQGFFTEIDVKNLLTAISHRINPSNSKLAA